MAKLQKREMALQLRKLGKSYSDIKASIGVSKSTLSLWLREYPLPPERIKELRDNNTKTTLYKKKPFHNLKRLL